MAGDIRRGVNKFNLTFSGEILAGHDPAQVKLRFARMFAIDDPVRLERFFSGETVILRRNLERKAAAQCYHELHLLGALAALVKVPADDAEPASTPAASTPPAKAAKAARRPTATNESTRPVRAAASDKTWAVSAAAAKGRANGKSGVVPITAASPDAGQRNTADIAAGIKARKLEAQRQASEKAARERAALAEQERSAAEEAARREAAAAERKRLAAEEAARQAAEKKRLEEEEAATREAIAAEAARRAAEEAARKLAIKEEARRKAAEEDLRRKAERKQRKAEQAQRKAEEAARRKTEQQEKKRREAEEEARRKAALEEKKRLEAEEAARRKAELEVQKRREAEEAARRKAAIEERKRQEAAEAARRKAAQEEQARREAEEARRIAAIEQIRRVEAEETARRKAELADLKRREAEEDARLQAELAAIKRREAEEAERLQAELDAQARQAAAQAAQIKADAQRQQQEAQRQSAERRRAIAEALAARQARQAEKRRKSSAAQTRRDPQQPQPSAPVARELPLPTPTKSPKARIRTSLEVPPRKPGQTSAESPAPEPRKRQPGEPNLYKLRPFRNSDEVRNRAAHARRRARHGYTLGMVALAALLLVAGGFLQRTVVPVTPGARAVVVVPQSGPLLLAGDSLLFHDRAGIGTQVQPLSALGIDTLDPPLAFDDSGTLFAVGSLAGDQAHSSARQLLRCEAPLTQCTPLSSQLQDNNIDAFAINPVDGSLLLADRSTGLLMKVDREGAIAARAELTFPEQLAIRLHSGLLLMNSATAPAISVLRYENNAFGKQLDEILLLPPDAQQAEELRVGDFLWSGDAWWVTLYHPESGRTGLYRFDEEWNFLDQVDLPATTGPLQLINWGQKTLVNDPQRLAIQRISAQGVVEAPFLSAQLETVSAEQQRRARLAEIAWRGALLLCALGAALGLGLGYLQRRRALVYQPRREQGAEPLDEHIGALQWVDPVANRQVLLRRRMTSYALLAIGILLLAVALSVGTGQLVALLLALGGPAIALLFLSRRSIGHIGLLGDRLVLVDHSGLYQLAGGSRVQYRGPFLSIDDVVVYCGGPLLPAFSAHQVQKQVRPLALGGVKVDRDTMIVKLLQSRHPLALGALTIGALLVAAIVVLCLQGIA